MNVNLLKIQPVFYHDCTILRSHQLFSIRCRHKFRILPDTQEVSYLLLGGDGSSGCPCGLHCPGEGVLVPHYRWAGMTALAPYLVFIPVRGRGTSSQPPKGRGNPVPHVGVGGWPVFSWGVCMELGGYFLKGFCLARLPLSWPFG